MPYVDLPPGVTDEGSSTLFFPEGTEQSVIDKYVAGLGPGTTEPEPRQGFVGRSAAGLKSGTAAIGEGVGTLAGVAGRAVGSTRLSDAGFELADIFTDYRERALEGFEPNRPLTDVFQEEGFVSAAAEAVRPSRLVPQLAEFTPQLALGFIPGALALRFGAGAAKAAAVAGVSSVAAASEASDVHKEVLERTGNTGAADRAFLSSGLAVGLLNAAGLGGVLARTPFSRTLAERADETLGAVIKEFGGKAPKDLAIEKLKKGPLKKVTNVLARGLGEAVTEYLEEPANLKILQDAGVEFEPGEARQRLLHAIDVTVPAFLIGGGLSIPGTFSPATTADLESNENLLDQQESLSADRLNLLLDEFDVPEADRESGGVILGELFKNFAFTRGQQTNQMFDENYNFLKQTGLSGETRQIHQDLLDVQTNLSSAQGEQAALLKEQERLLRQRKRDVLFRAFADTIDSEQLTPFAPPADSTSSRPTLEQTEFNNRRAEALRQEGENLEEIAAEYATQLAGIEDQESQEAGYLRGARDYYANLAFDRFDQADKLTNFNAQSEFPTLQQLDSSKRFDLPSIGLFHRSLKNIQSFSDKIFDKEGLATVAQVRNQIFADVRKEEMQALGLDKFLDEKGKTGRLVKGKRKVSREEVEEFILDNLVDVKSHSVRRPIETPEGQENTSVTSTTSSEATGNRLRAPQFELYVARGPHSNYREHVFTIAGVAQEGGHFENFRGTQVRTPEIIGLEDRLSNRTREHQRLQIAMQSAPSEAEFRQLRSETEEIWREIVALNGQLDELYSQARPDSVLGWVRTTDRLTQDGQRVLFIEEVQSDIGQQLQRRLKYNKIIDLFGNPGQEFTEDMWHRLNSAIAEARDEGNRREHQILSMLEHEVRAAGNRVPLKRDEDRFPLDDVWHKTFLRRAVYLAAQEGYDGVSINSAADNTTLPRERGGEIPGGNFYDKTLPTELRKLTGRQSIQDVKIGDEVLEVPFWEGYDTEVAPAPLPEEQIDMLIDEFAGHSEFNFESGKYHVFFDRLFLSRNLYDALSSQALEALETASSQADVNAQVGGLLTELEALGIQVAEPHHVSSVVIPNPTPSATAMFSAETTERILDEGFSLFQNVRFAKGDAISFIDENKQAQRVLIRGLLSPDIATAVHEMAHSFVLLAKGDFKAQLEQAAFDSNFFPKAKGVVPIEKWDRNAHEVFARGVEKWLMTGEVPRGASQEVEEAFAQLSDRMKEIYKGAQVFDNMLPFMNRQVRQLLDSLLTDPTTFEPVSEALAAFDELQALMSVAMDTDAATEPLESADWRAWIREQDTTHGLRGRRTEPQRPRREELNERLDSLIRGMIGDNEQTDFAKLFLDVLETVQVDESIPVSERMWQAYKDAKKKASKIKGLSIDRRVLAHYASAMLAGRSFLQITESGFLSTRAKQKMFTTMREQMQGLVTDRSAVGRALQNFRVIYTLERALRDLERMADTLTQAELEQFVNLDFNDVESVRTFMQEVEAKTPEGKRAIRRRNLPHVLRSIWYNSMLSNPGTQAINATTNILWAAYLGGHRLNTAVIDKVWSAFTGRPRSTYAKEALFLFRSQAYGYVGRNQLSIEGARAAATGTITQELAKKYGTESPYTKWDEEVGQFTSVLKEFLIPNPKDREGARKRRILAGVLEGPSRMMQAVDLYMKGIAEVGESEALEYGRRRARQEGNEAQYIARLYADERARPSRGGLKKVEVRVDAAGHPLPGQQGKLEEAFEAVKEARVRRFMEHATFQDKPGRWTRAVLAVRDSSNLAGIPIGRLSIPFVQTIANLAKRGIEFTPVLGAALGRQYGLSGPEIVAKQLEGGLLLSVVLMGAMSDEDDSEGAITGAPPRDKARRESFFRRGMQPYSVKVGENWYDYRRFDPFGLPLAMVANMKQRLEEIGENNLDPARLPVEGFSLLADLAFNMSKTLLDSTFLANPLQATEGQHSFERFVKRTTGTLVPFSGFLRGARRAYEATEEGQVKIREGEGFLSTFGFVPLTEIEDPQRLDVFGEGVARKVGSPGLLSGMKEFFGTRIQQQGTDVVEEELANIQLYPGMPGEVLTVQGVRMRIPDEAYRTYVQRYGTRAKESLAQLFQLPGYKNQQSVRIKASMIDRRLRRIRAQEQARLRGQLVRSEAFRRARSLNRTSGLSEG